VPPVRWPESLSEIPLKLPTPYFEGDLVTELERRRESLRCDDRFVRVLVNSESDQYGLNVWCLECFPRPGAEWKQLRLQVARVGGVGVMQGRIVWEFPRAYGKVSRPGTEYRTRPYYGRPEQITDEFSRELPDLLRTFDKVVARCRPSTRFAQWIMSHFPAARRYHQNSLRSAYVA
jgi:hypothetical protein